MELYLGSIALMPVVVGIIEALKRVGLPSKYAPLANLLLSTAAYVVVTIAAGDPVFAKGAMTAVEILIILLGSWGFYEGQKFARGK